MAQAAPNTISGLVQWFDAQDINAGGSQPADGASVSSWQDKSGTNQDLGSTLGEDPIFDEDGWNAANSCPGVRFGSNNTASALIASDPFSGTMTDSTTFLIHREANRRNSLTLSYNGNIVNNVYVLTWNNGQMYQRIGNNWVQGTHGVTAGNPIFYTAVQSSTVQPGRQTRVNGATLSNENAFDVGTTTNGTHLGWGWNQDLYWFDGWVAELIIYDRALTAAEVANVESYLFNKWNNACDQDVDLQFTKSVNDNNVDEGQLITYTISVTNNGPGNATTLQILDNLPPGLTLQSLGTPSHGTASP